MYGFSSLMKQNKKAKICFVIYIAGFFFKIFPIMKCLRSKKRQKSPVTTTYSRTGRARVGCGGGGRRVPAPPNPVSCKRTSGVEHNVVLSLNILAFSWSVIAVFYHLQQIETSLLVIRVDGLHFNLIALSFRLQRGGIQVADLIDMVVFPVNPLTDFGVDLAELWHLRCSTQTLISMGITFEHLIAAIT